MVTGFAGSRTSTTHVYASPLAQFADVARIGYEEYGWLFRIYTGELGDGHLEWNHNYILRRMHIENGIPPEHALLSLRA